MAVGTVFVLTAGEIDLSIGSIVAVSALLAAVALRNWPWPVGVAAGLGAGAAIGAVNGALVAYGRLPSFLVTLATMGVFAGVAPPPDRSEVGADRERHIQRPVRLGLAFRRPFACTLDGRGGGDRLFRLARDALRRARARDRRQAARRARSGIEVLRLRFPSC